MLFDLKRRTDILHLLTLMLLFSLPALVSYNAMSQLEVIKSSGTLRVATRNTPASYYNEKEGPAGFEYELAQAFAEDLGVQLELLVPDTIPGLFRTIRQRDAHLIAASVNTSEAREQLYDFSTPYASSISTVIYRVRQGVTPPESIEEMIGSSILILKGSVQAEQLNRLKEYHPELSWTESNELTSTDILDKVFAEEVDFAIVDSTVFDSQSSFYPGLGKAFMLGEPLPIAWVFNKNSDGSLKQAVNHFLERPATQRLIRQLKEKYFERHNPLNFFDTVTFKADMATRLPCLEQYFYMAEQETDIDWMLLAAIAYQESHWRADAVSPTGVRGIMMLTNAAAEEVGVTDRTDPVQSILGGAEYLINVRKKIPDRIPEPDHTWFALAGYNVGFGHLEDARILTQRANKDPDKWEDVREFLPLLAREKYYKTVKYGYARGQEPVQYVANIQEYMQILSWEKQVEKIRLERLAAQKARKEANAQKAETNEQLNKLPPTL